jgi:extradiol dioxygenase family protein
MSTSWQDKANRGDRSLHCVVIQLPELIFHHLPKLCSGESLVAQEAKQSHFGVHIRMTDLHALPIHVQQNGVRHLCASIKRYGFVKLV